MTAPASLPAGPGLDRLVAEKVMGFVSEDYVPPGRWHCRPDGREEWFQPSTNIAHAWEVVERLDAQGWDVVVINCTGCHGEAGRWAADIVNDEHGAIGVHADTAPLAICLAALAAVAGEKS